MHHHSLQAWDHEHVFLGPGHDDHERRTWLVVALTAGMMAIEIAGGTVFGSMALLADGWHMSTHAGALAIAALAYRYARTHARDPRFVFGTGKLGDLAGFTNAIVLALVAVMIGYDSVTRLFSPMPIQFDEAIFIAIAGLAVNLWSAWLLGRHEPDPDHHDHGLQGHVHRARRHHAHHDHNARAAYWHVLADAMTSVLAIVGLLIGRFYGWVWLDPVIGVAGSLVIAHWAWRLIRDAGTVLLDAAPDSRLLAMIRDRVEVRGDRIADLHVWRVGPGHHAAIISVVSGVPAAAATYKARLADLPGLSHVTVEVHRCS